MDALRGEFWSDVWLFPLRFLGSWATLSLFRDKRSHGVINVEFQIEILNFESNDVNWECQSVQYLNECLSAVSRPLDCPPCLIDSGVFWKYCRIEY